MSEPARCKRCNSILTSEESIKRGYGKTCYKIITLQGKNTLRLKLRKLFNTIRHNKQKEPQIQVIQKTNTPEFEDLLDRIRKVELDNTFLKHQIKHKTVRTTNTGIYHDDSIERIKLEESEKIVDPLLREYRNAFKECVSELQEVLKIRKYEIEQSTNLNDPPQAIDLSNAKIIID